MQLDIDYNYVCTAAIIILSVINKYKSWPTQERTRYNVEEKGINQRRECFIIVGNNWWIVECNTFEVKFQNLRCDDIILFHYTMAFFGRFQMPINALDVLNISKVQWNSSELFVVGIFIIYLFICIYTICVRVSLFF